MQLRDDLTKLINDSHADAWATFDWVRERSALYGVPKKTAERWKNPGEPAFVSNLLEYPFLRYRLRDIIYKHLNPVGLCAGTPLATGVFIHQKPKVSFGRSRSQVELGDLLLVRHHFRYGNAAPEGRAFLLQAKCAEHPRTGALAGKEAHQFALYSNWATRFHFPHGELGSSPDGTKWWNFGIGSMPELQSSGVYGIVAKSRPGSIATAFPAGCSWAIGSALPPKSGASPAVDASSLSFADALDGFLRGSWGRRWDAFPRSDDHWSSFVHQCLVAAANWRGYPVQRLGVADAPRRRDALAFVRAFSDAHPAMPTGAPRPHQTSFLYWLLAGDWSDEPVRAQAEEWERSTKANPAQGDKPPTRPLEENLQGMPRAGLSVLYVATFGPGTLEAQPDETPQPRPEGWGSW